MQEYLTFKKFGDALLSRSTKLTDLGNLLDSYNKEVEEDSADHQKIKKSLPYSPRMHQLSYVCSALSTLICNTGTLIK